MLRRLLLIAMLLTFAVAGTAAAAKAGKSFAVDQTDIHYGDTVTFSYTGYTATHISLECFKVDGNGDPIASESVLFLDQPVGTGFELTGWDGSPVWCGAILWMKSVARKNTNFTVAA